MTSLVDRQAEKGKTFFTVKVTVKGSLDSAVVPPRSSCFMCSFPFEHALLLAVERTTFRQGSLDASSSCTLLAMKTDHTFFDQPWRPAEGTRWIRRAPLRLMLLRSLVQLCRVQLHTGSFGAFGCFASVLHVARGHDVLTVRFSTTCSGLAEKNAAESRSVRSSPCANQHVDPDDLMPTLRALVLTLLLTLPTSSPLSKPSRQLVPLADLPPQAC